MRDPIGEIREIQVSAYVDFATFKVVFRVALSILHFVEDVLKFGHTLYLFVKEGAKEVFVRDAQLIRLGHFIDVRLRLIDLYELLQDVEHFSSHLSVDLFDL